MIKDSEVLGFGLIESRTGKVIEASNDLEKLLKRAQELAKKLNERVDVVHYLGSFYPENEQFPETL